MTDRDITIPHDKILFRTINNPLKKQQEINSSLMSRETCMQSLQKWRTKYNVFVLYLYKRFYQSTAFLYVCMYEKTDDTICLKPTQVYRASFFVLPGRCPS